MKKVKKDKNVKKLSPFSERQAEDITQYLEDKKHTQVMELGDHVSCKIRLQTTIFPDRESEIGVDIRKFLNDKYPFRGGRQGILIEKDKWLEFMQKATDFTISVYGADVFYSDEPQATPSKQQQVAPSASATVAPRTLQQVSQSEKPLKRKSPKEEKWIKENL